MAKRSHYDTLGVKPDAAPAEIKRAYRKRATKAHPDKNGGSHDEMAALSEAYMVLRDPERRQRYDQTGEDRQIPVETRVRGMLLDAFSRVLAEDRPNVLRAVKTLITNAKRAMGEARHKTKRDLLKAKARSGVVTVKEGENVFQMVIDQAIRQGEEHLAKLDEEIKLVDLALEELDKYESSEPNVISPPYADPDIQGMLSQFFAQRPPRGWE